MTAVQHGPDRYPELMKIIDAIAMQNPLQRKRIYNFIHQQEPTYWHFAEEVSRALNFSFLRSRHDREEAARSYNTMCMDILREQIQFRKTGVYRLDDAVDAHTSVYSRPEIMRYYMVGLLLSYLFWPNHYKMFCFFRDCLEQVSLENYLEVGVGHGLFTAEAIRRVPDLDVVLMDISDVSLQIADEILATFQVDRSHIQFIQGDFMTVSTENRGFDFITLGEVLEHVNDAVGFLGRARELLRPGGIVFLSTCVNCPAVDHVFHFHTVDEIRDLIQKAGLTVARELILPAEDVPEDRWLEERVTINYAAVLTKNGEDRR